MMTVLTPLSRSYFCVTPKKRYKSVASAIFLTRPSNPYQTLAAFVDRAVDPFFTNLSPTRSS
jgi:hypothetical protein